MRTLASAAGHRRLIEGFGISVTDAELRTVMEQTTPKALQTHDDVGGGWQRIGLERVRHPMAVRVRTGPKKRYRDYGFNASTLAEMNAIVRAASFSWFLPTGTGVGSWDAAEGASPGTSDGRTGGDVARDSRKGETHHGAEQGAEETVQTVQSMQSVQSVQTVHAGTRQISRKMKDGSPHFVVGSMHLWLAAATAVLVCVGLRHKLLPSATILQHNPLAAAQEPAAMVEVNEPDLLRNRSLTVLRD